jgi:hypothetical protein
VLKDRRATLVRSVPRELSERLVRRVRKAMLVRSVLKVLLD